MTSFCLYKLKKVQYTGLTMLPKINQIKNWFESAYHKSSIASRDGAREEILGAKTVRVLTASEARKILTDRTFQIGLKCDYTP